MTTPFLTYNKVDIKNAIATSAAVGVPIAIAGSVGFIMNSRGEFCKILPLNGTMMVMCPNTGYRGKNNHCKCSANCRMH
jgi:hypothetical protein